MHHWNSHRGLAGWAAPLLMVLLVLVSLAALAGEGGIVPRPAQIAGRPNVLDRVFSPQW